MDFTNVFDEEETVPTRGRTPINKRVTDDHDNDEGFKSKNLNAERRRREKLKNRMFQLRSIVPIITNAMTGTSRNFQMNKATIITDAITYIEELQNTVKELSNELLALDEIAKEEPETESFQADDAEKMREWGIEPEVTVTHLDGNKLWIKIVFEKKRGGFMKLLEAMSVLGIDLVDTSVTTTKGALLVTSCIEGSHGRMLAAEKVKDLLVEIIRGI